MDSIIQLVGESIMGLLARDWDFISSGLDFVAQATSAGGTGIPSWDDKVVISPLTSDHVMGIGDYLMEKGVTHANKMTGVARALGAVFAVIIAGKEAYKVMAEQRGFDILDILRPILFAFILAFWGPVVNTVLGPGQAIENHCRGLYSSQCARVDSLRKERLEKCMTINMRIKEQSANVNQQQTAEKQGGGIIQWFSDLLDKGKEAVSNFLQTVNNVGITIFATFEALLWGFLERIIIWLGELFYTVAIYIVFMLKALFVTVLSMFGPIYMAASILPAWKDAWKQWVERMVHASLYGAMAYLAMAFSMHLITYCLEADISSIDAIVNSSGSVTAFLQFSAGGLGTVATTAIAYFVGAFAMKAVPEMASMVFPGSHSMGASNFIGGMQGAVENNSIGLAKKAIIKG